MNKSGDSDEPLEAGAGGAQPPPSAPPSAPPLHQQAPAWSAAEAAAAHAELEAIVQREGLQLHTQPGLLAAAYVLGGAIGKGKFATVYRATRQRDGVEVAVKEIALFDVADAKSREKCLKEIRLIQHLEHPNIVRFLEGFVEGRHLVLVFEFAEAGDLKRQLRKARERGARFEERIVWRYFAQIAEAVAYLHSRRIIHRDLKPANIFLTLAGAVKVGDLGLGRLLSQDTLVAHSKVGTPLYMAPECLKGGGHEYAADVWSLGCILYELAMAQSPFKEEGLNLYGLFQKITSGVYAPLADNLSLQLRQLVTGMLAQDPTARPDITRVVQVAREMKAATSSSSSSTAARARAGGGSGGDGGAAVAAEGVSTAQLPDAAAAAAAAETPKPVLARPASAAGRRGSAAAPAAAPQPQPAAPPSAAAASSQPPTPAPTPSPAATSPLPPPAAAPPPPTEAELLALCRDLPVEASSWVYDRLRMLGFLAAAAPPAPPPTQALLEAHQRAAVPRALLTRVLFATPPAPAAAPLGLAAHINGEVQFACLLGTLQWLSACLSVVGGDGAGGQGAAGRLCSALQAASALQGQHSALVTAQRHLCPALAAFSPALAAHCSAVGAPALAVGWGLGALFPLLCLAEAAVQGRRARLPCVVRMVQGSSEGVEGVEGEEGEEEGEEEGWGVGAGGGGRHSLAQQEAEEAEPPLFAASSSSSSSSSSAVTTRLATPAAPGVDEALWHAEVLRFSAAMARRQATAGEASSAAVGVQPTLALLGGWRQRVQVLRVTHGAVQQDLQLLLATAPAPGAPLAAALPPALAVGPYVAELRAQLERLGSAERALHQAGSAHPLAAAAAAHSAVAAAVGAGQQLLQRARAGVAERSAALCSLEEALEALEHECQAAATGVSSDARLVELRTALRSLQRQNRDMDVAVGIVHSAVSAQMLRRHEEARRRARNSSSGGGGSSSALGMGVWGR